MKNAAETTWKGRPRAIRRRRALTFGALVCAGALAVLLTGAGSAQAQNEPTFLEQLQQVIRETLIKQCTEAFDESSAASSCSNSKQTLVPCKSVKGDTAYYTVCRDINALTVDLEDGKCVIDTTCETINHQAVSQRVVKTVDETRNLSNQDGYLR